MNEPSGQIEGHWDVVIVGAGPAGSSAALAALHADPSLRVLLLDRADFPRDKSCGDGIPPHVGVALARVGVTGVTDGWTPLTQLELARGETAVARDLAREVHVIPRKVFDARLVERAVERGAVLQRRRVHSLAELPAGAVVVGADGAHSFVRAELGLPWGRRALAIRGYAPTPDHRRGTQVIRYGDRRQPAYAWAFDRGDGLSNVGYGELLPGPGEPGGAPSRALLMEQLEELLPGAAEGGTDWKGHHLPLSGWRWHQPDGRVLLVGDAAGLINPMTGEGIYYAVATGVEAGLAAARAVRAHEPLGAGALHRQAVRRLLGRHLKHTWAASRLAEHPVIVDGGIRVARRDPRVFDELVELGLGDGRISGRLVLGLAGGLGRKGAERVTDRLRGRLSGRVGSAG
ncbi:NAD(P)/FAD-dependent oxidoreductase [Nocardioides flavescens]|uniref:NAD(P)/FAD-dependent oxidoreductase n=1 Tax=Nocardioides flavescens TaxID=2691959 RepID=UPI0019268AC8|nr:hyaluronate lyase [Nocardioides flavescens]